MSAVRKACWALLCGATVAWAIAPAAASAKPASTKPAKAAAAATAEPDDGLGEVAVESGFFRDADVSGVRIGMTHREAKAGLGQRFVLSRSMDPFCPWKGGPSGVTIGFFGGASPEAAGRVVEVSKHGARAPCDAIEQGMLEKYGPPRHKGEKTFGGARRGRYTWWLWSDEVAAPGGRIPVEKCIDPEGILDPQRVWDRNALLVTLREWEDERGFCTYDVYLYGGRLHWAIRGAQASGEHRAHEAEVQKDAGNKPTF